MKIKINLSLPFKLFVFVVVVMSCNNQSENKIKTINLLEFSKTVKIPLDEKSTYEFYNFQVRNDTLIVLNQPNNSLDFYNLTTENLFHRIYIPAEGETGIQKLYGFHFYNNDTIFTFSQFRINNVKIFNFEGNYRSTLTVNNSFAGMYGIINHASIPSMPTYFFGKKLFFQILPGFDEEMIQDNFIHEFIFDIYSGEIYPDSTIVKPKTLQNTPAYTYGVNRIKLSENETIYSWKFSDSISYVFEDEDNLISTLSFFWGDGDLIKVKPGLEMSNEETQKSKANSIQYGKVVFDNHSGHIHRIKFLPVDEVLTGNLFLIRDFEIISGDKNGNLLGKTVFKGKKYDPRVLFFGPDGIYIPKINPNFENLTEDFIEYDVFQIIK
ncbi:DUF4221 domain-containing protein [Aquiflexum sp. TKW24L]|uniref:DUF4221 domain-containing protein n=1 Tax=Aquiflexum sp. TKW24L TaxID=2942212 RepID=UPI0020BFED2F|nr:DUF4221 domain-containing protein [Aquiflexum sp. TKW24L]MCL6258515.1 DUF4221 domain-containing protein [Aquiflexum sp. TKW24L]